jgi:cyanophycinase-like exopeptidase
LLLYSKINTSQKSQFEKLRHVKTTRQKNNSMKNSLLLFLFINLCQPVFTQSYTNWITGDTADVSTNHQQGLVLAGGATDNDDAMKWMLERADGGDVVVLRASGSDGYNDYFFSELGINVNSVETILFNNEQAATDQYVLTQIANAEIIFLAGGDQYDYYQYWKDTPVEDALNQLINEKQITVGGTSAGMAILGDVYYTPPGGSLDSEEALSNPFHPDTELIGKGDFINAPFMTNVITDTHYDQRERWGRHLTFLARITTDFETPAFGIASNEYVAVCVDENGIARVFGEYPEYEDYAYFLGTKCHDEYAPEVIEVGTPLTWDKNGSAVSVYKLPGNIEGSNTFDLNDWETGSGGNWEHWYAIEGELSQVEVDSSCNINTSVSDFSKNEDLTIFPNPVQNELTVAHFNKNLTGKIRVLNLLGQPVLEKETHHFSNQINVETLEKGVYILEIAIDGNTQSVRFLKI